jgi:hypothetical protein
MVNAVVQLTSSARALIAGRLLAATDQTRSLLDRLDPERRAKVIMALLGVTLAGLALVALAVLCGRHFRRVVRKPAKATPRHENDWFRKPLAPHEPAKPQVSDPE